MNKKSYKHPSYYVSLSQVLSDRIYKVYSILKELSQSFSNIRKHLSLVLCVKDGTLNLKEQKKLLEENHGRNY